MKEIHEMKGAGRRCRFQMLSDGLVACFPACWRAWSALPRGRSPELADRIPPHSRAMGQFQSDHIR